MEKNLRILDKPYPPHNQEILDTGNNPEEDNDSKYLLAHIQIE